MPTDNYHIASATIDRKIVVGSNLLCYKECICLCVFVVVNEIKSLPKGIKIDTV